MNSPTPTDPSPLDSPASDSVGPRAQSVPAGVMSVGLNSSATAESVELPRADHSYASAPNHQLATAILDLCSSATLVQKFKQVSTDDGSLNCSFRPRRSVLNLATICLSD